MQLYVTLVQMYLFERLWSLPLHVEEYSPSYVHCRKFDVTRKFRWDEYLATFRHKLSQAKRKVKQDKNNPR